MSFLEERSPSLAIQRITEYTEDYISLLTDLAVKCNVNIGGSTPLKKRGKFITSPTYSDVTARLKNNISFATPNERKCKWGISAGDRGARIDTDCGKIAIQICYDIEFPELARIAADQGENLYAVLHQASLRVRYCSQARAVENQIYTAQVRSETVAGKYGYSIRAVTFLLRRILNLPETESSVKRIRISKWS